MREELELLGSRVTDEFEPLPPELKWRILNWEAVGLAEIVLMLTTPDVAYLRPSEPCLEAFCEVVTSEL